MVCFWMICDLLYIAVYCNFVRLFFSFAIVEACVVCFEVSLFWRCVILFLRLWEYFVFVLCNEDWYFCNIFLRVIMCLFRIFKYFVWFFLSFVIIVRSLLLCFVSLVFVVLVLFCRDKYFLLIDFVFFMVEFSELCNVLFVWVMFRFLVVENFVLTLYWCLRMFNLLVSVSNLDLVLLCDVVMLSKLFCKNLIFCCYFLMFVVWFSRSCLFLASFLFVLKLSWSLSLVIWVWSCCVFILVVCVFIGCIDLICWILMCFFLRIW